MRVCTRFRSVVVLAAIVSVFCVLAGLMISYLADLPTGASVVLVNALVFAVLWGAGKLKKA